MGTYLSTPITDKGTESGASLDCPQVPCSWSVVDMQGWRKSMEDSHVAVTNIPLSSADADAKVFGVFDGHGGPEVARLCGMYMVSVLTQQPSWKKEEDRLTEMPGESTYLDGTEAAETPVGLALRDAFHALDRMVDDPTLRDELEDLRTDKPEPGCQRTVTSIPPPVAMEVTSTSSEAMVESTPSDAAQEAMATDSTPASEEAVDVSASPEVSPETAAPAPETTEEEDAAKDDDSTEKVGAEQVDDLDRDMMDEEADAPATTTTTATTFDATAEGATKQTQVTSMLQKILSLGAQGAGQVIMSVGGEDAPSSSPAPGGPQAQGAVKPYGNSNNTITMVDPMAGKSAFQPMIIQNGRPICNLPDHPIHAGATAIVAVITGKILTVANAGDSRAILCRGGRTIPLSFDHKPQQERERSRIAKAGGFVNQFGRVNGNLNLSRSIGDLKYKQVPGIAPADQMITSEPDIIQLALEPEDEFLILGCDGIWDCLTNEGAVDYVRTRINSKSLKDIGVEMLDEIISENPRITQGIGGDNMTIMIVDLQPNTRPTAAAPAVPMQV